MPRIIVERIIPFKKEKVYEILKKVEDFPTFMKSIRSLKVVDRSDNRLVTSWQVDIDGALIMWEEEDFFDDKNFSLRFNMLKGDYGSYSGEWKLEDSGANHTKINLTANFDWGVPVLEKFVGDVLEKKAKKYALSMLKALKNKLNE